jgi:septum formation protein
MQSNPKSLILASQSPRRAQLLREAGYQFIVLAPDDEAEALAEKNYPPDRLVIELALRKAENIVQKLQREVERDVGASVVLAADTIALCQGEILGKPEDKNDARRMLRQLSGKVHSVLTGVCLWDVSLDHHLEFLEVTMLRMDELSDKQLDDFLLGDGWQGKAGAFGYQDGLDWVHIVQGLASNVVGLPVERLPHWLDMLAKFP